MNEEVTQGPRLPPTSNRTISNQKRGRWERGVPRLARVEKWRTLLFTEFHDVLPGTSIREVYEEVEPQLEKTLEEVLASLPPPVRN